MCIRDRYAQREDVGAVGAKLYYADKTIQHAGVVIGLGAHRTAGHTHYRIPVPVSYTHLSHCGGPKDILRKIRNKSHQKSL